MKTVVKNIKIGKISENYMPGHSITHYNHKIMKDLRVAFEDRIRNWPDVVLTEKFHVPHYIVNDIVFARIFTERMVLTKLTDVQKMEIQEKINAKPFKTLSMSAAIWTGIKFTNIDDISSFLPYVRMSYENSQK